MRVLVACEYSGEVRRAFRALGHDAWSCDLLPSEDDSPHHLQMDAIHAAWQTFDPPESRPWDLMIAHPPCTYLSRAGWHWVNKPDSAVHPLKGEPRRQAAKEAAAFFMALWNAPIPRIAIENPRPIVHANLPPYTQVIQPWEHGHGETKATCLWLKGLPKIVPTNVVEGREGRIHKMPPGKDRAKERSRTYRGIAEAFASQWGVYCECPQGSTWVKHNPDCHLLRNWRRPNERNTKAGASRRETGVWAHMGFPTDWVP